MILRKPYAILIKYFRLIHLFIGLLIVYLINKTNVILHFFKDYITDDLVNFNTSGFINFFVYFSILLIIGMSIIIIILMRKKEKPLFFYILTVIVFSALFVGFVYDSSIINSLEFNLLDRKTIGLARDITRFMLFGEWLLLIPYVIRTLGFDIKKFDFKRDLQELDILEEDSEEFELLSPVNMDKISLMGRKKIRQLRYYYLENKYFILIFSGIIITFLGIFIFNSIDFASFKRYKEKDVIKLDNFYTLTIDDSYITTTSDDGKNISVNDKCYLIVKFTVNSKYNGKFSLDTDKFIVKIKGEEYIASRNYYNYFKSYGIG